MTNMNIGQLAKASGVNAKLIRYYESIGLIPAAARNEANYRLYREQDIDLLKFIKRARALSFSIPEIEKLLGLWHNPQRASAEVKALALEHLAELERRIQEMQLMCHELQQLALRCQGDDNPDCPILEELAGGLQGAKKGERVHST